MPVQINELSAEIEVAPAQAGAGAEMPAEEAQRTTERVEWTLRRQQQLAERLAAWSFDD